MTSSTKGMTDRVTVIVRDPYGVVARYTFDTPAEARRYAMSWKHHARKTGRTYRVEFAEVQS